MAIDVGGFFAQLVLKSDQASFDKSVRDLKSVEDQTKKTGLTFGAFVGDVIKGFALVGGAAVGAAYSVSQVQGKMALTAKGAGLGYTELAKWSSAMKTVGLDASKVVDSLGNVNKAVQDYLVDPNTASDYTKLAENLAALQKRGGVGIDANVFRGMGGTGRAQMVVGAVQSQFGTSKYQGSLDLADRIIPGIADLIRQLNINKELNVKNKTNLPETLTAFLNSAPNWQSDQSILQGAANSRTFDMFTVTLDQMWLSAGETLATTFKPIVEDLTKWIEKNKGPIKDFFMDVGGVLKTTADLLGATFNGLAGIADVFGAGFDWLKGFKTPEERALATKVRAAMGWSGGSEQGIAFNSSNPIYQSEAAYFEKTGQVYSKQVAVAIEKAMTKAGVDPSYSGRYGATIGELQAREIAKTGGKVDLYLHLDGNLKDAKVNSIADGGVLVYHQKQ